jgi:hypothetical protein
MAYFDVDPLLANQLLDGITLVLQQAHGDELGLIRQQSLDSGEAHVAQLPVDFDLRRSPHGEIEVGDAGSRIQHLGKSTTLAALINKMNLEKAIHIITIEDPIEYLHPHQKATINQREVGSDTQTFALALRAALRQAPKVILVGEMRDAETRGKESRGRGALGNGRLDREART